MSRKSGEELFDAYDDLKRRRDLIACQLNNFSGVTKEDVIQTMTFSHPDDSDVRVQTSGTSDKTARIAMVGDNIVHRENLEYRQYLEDRYCEVDDEIRLVENTVMSLGEPRSSIVEKILQGTSTWDSIAEEFHLCRSTVANYRKAAIQTLEENLRMKEQLELDYMLS